MGVWTAGFGLLADAVSTLQSFVVVFVGVYVLVIFAYVLTDSSEKYTISVGIAHLFGEYSVAWNELMAAGLVAAVPPIVLYLFTSRFLVSGLTAGALK